MGLASFILANIEPILIEWEAFARNLLPGREMSKLDLRDDAELILRAAAQDMQNAQSHEQQKNKSQGHGGRGSAESQSLDDASALHGVGRVDSGFNINEVVSEYRALRASVLRLWRESQPQLDPNDLDDITRFDEAIDQSLGRAINRYSERIDQSRYMFLAILSHDLRNPLTCIRMAANHTLKTKDDPVSVAGLSMIETKVEAITRLISDMADFASSGLGRTMPLSRGPVNLLALCREVIEEYRTTHPGRTLHFHSDGELIGIWDANRLRQVISNLVINAIQHGSPEGKVELSVTSEELDSEKSGPEGSTVVLRVHNEGGPIPQELLPTIFNPLIRYTSREAKSARRNNGSIGLGLYIVREIVMANGGTVEVTSTAQEGTTFSVRIPRVLSPDGVEPGRIYDSID